MKKYFSICVNFNLCRVCKRLRHFLWADKILYGSEIFFLDFVVSKKWKWRLVKIQIKKFTTGPSQTHVSQPWWWKKKNQILQKQNVVVACIVTMYAPPHTGLCIVGIPTIPPNCLRRRSSLLRLWAGSRVIMSKLGYRILFVCAGHSNFHHSSRKILDLAYCSTV